MIVVKVELWSARTHEVIELARMHIANVGGNDQVGDYEVRTLRGRSAEALDRGAVQRQGTVMNHARLRLHVWHLVAEALSAVGYGAA